jgi:hypothetical protein
MRTHRTSACSTIVSVNEPWKGTDMTKDVHQSLWQEISPIWSWWATYTETTPTLRQRMSVAYLRAQAAKTKADTQAALASMYEIFMDEPPVES